MKDKENISHLVIIGAWNKYVFTQDWIKNNIFPNEDSINMHIPINMDASLKFITQDLSVAIVKDRLEISILKLNDIAFIKAITTLRQIVRLLFQTPVYSFGVNGLFFENSPTYYYDHFIEDDISKFVGEGRKVLNQGVVRSVEMEDSSVLNITIRQEIDEISIDFNYNYNIKSLERVLQILGDDDELLLRKRKEMLYIMENIYELKIDK